MSNDLVRSNPLVAKSQQKNKKSKLSVAVDTKLSALSQALDLIRICKAEIDSAEYKLEDPRQAYKLAQAIDLNRARFDGIFNSLMETVMSYTHLADQE